MTHLLEKEEEFYQAHKAEYLQKYKGKHILIYKDELRGVFDTGKDALNYAVENKFRRNHYMITRVQEEEDVFQIVQVRF